MMLGGAPSKASQTPSGGVSQAGSLAETASSAAAPGQPAPRPTAPSVPPASAPSTPEAMLVKARKILADGGDPGVLLRTAIHYRDRWARMVEEHDAKAGTPQRLDGRASIYTGETYAEARDRWEAYRLLLVEETRGTHGGC